MEKGRGEGPLSTVFRRLWLVQTAGHRQSLAYTFENFKSIHDKVIGFLLLNMQMQTYWLQFILNSRTVLEQSSSSLSRRALHCLIYLSPSWLWNLRKFFVQVNLHIGLCNFFRKVVAVQENDHCIATELKKTLVHSSDICNGSSFQSWETDHGCPYLLMDWENPLDLKCLVSLNGSHGKNTNFFLRH